MNLGSHAGFIIAAYAAAVAVITALVGWIVADHRAPLSAGIVLNNSQAEIGKFFKNRVQRRAKSKK